MTNTTMQYQRPVCRGCWELRNNCGTCERCIATRPTAQAATAKLAVEAVLEREPKHHYLKCVQPYYAEVKARRKPFEIRLNDRDYRVGDTVTLHEWTGTDWTDDFTSARISYVTDFQQQQGYVVFGLEYLPAADAVPEVGPTLETMLEQERTYRGSIVGNVLNIGITLIRRQSETIARLSAQEGRDANAL